MGLEDKIPSSVQTRNLSKQILGSREDMPEYQLYMLYSQVDATGKNPETGARGIRNERYTYAVRFKEGEITGEYLFDRKHDPYQMNNLAGKEIKLASKLRKALVQMLADAEDPAYTVFSR